MVAFSAIEWCTHTANPWIGCQKVGPGCDYCYAETRDKRFEGGKHWGPGAPRRRTAPATRNAPLKWNRDAPAFHAEHGYWPRVFSGSLCDLFDNAVDPTWRRDHWAVIRETKDLRWMLLTKRIGNVIGMLPEGWLDGAFDHVGIMITVVNQDEADRDVPKLLNLPMAGNQWRGVSYEPALGPIDWTMIGADSTGEADALRGLTFCQGRNEPREHAKLDFIICGGESGDEARPMHPDWARQTRDQCAAAGTAFLFKQWGEWSSGISARDGDPGKFALHWAHNQGRWSYLDYGPRQFTMFGSDARMTRVGKKRAGRLLDGRIHNEFPRQLS
jgi:protein gp37